MKVRISNIQRFCLHDGPGIRTTVFLKGCNLKCPWCANPENIDYEFNEFTNIDTGEHGVFGQDIEITDLYEEIIKDREYYQMNNGGVTFSGGEPLLQIKKIEPLLKRLKEENINMCIETALNVPLEYVQIASKYIDEFIIDIKILKSAECNKVLNGDVKLYNSNLVYLSDLNSTIIFRIPLISEYTLDNENIELIIELVKKYKSQNIEIFKVHNLAESKYKSLNKPFISFLNVDDKEVETIYNKIKQAGLNVEIIKI